MHSLHMQVKIPSPTKPIPMSATRRNRAFQILLAMWSFAFQLNLPILILCSRKDVQGSRFSLPGDGPRCAPGSRSTGSRSRHGRSRSRSGRRKFLFLINFFLCCICFHVFPFWTSIALDLFHLSFLKGSEGHIFTEEIMAPFRCSHYCVLWPALHSCDA